jgi:hypothetical protein
MTIAYSGYGIPTPDSTDLNRTAHRIRYKYNMNWKYASTKTVRNALKKYFFLHLIKSHKSATYSRNLKSPTATYLHHQIIKSAIANHFIKNSLRVHHRYKTIQLIYNYDNVTNNTFNEMFRQCGIWSKVHFPMVVSDRLSNDISAKMLFNQFVESKRLSTKWSIPDGCLIFANAITLGNDVKKSI